jgi:hypothetical protein
LMQITDSPAMTQPARRATRAVASPTQT